MKSIKTEKIIDDASTKENLLDMLNWYKVDRAEYNWFEKLIFVDRNFKKIAHAIQTDTA